MQAEQIKALIQSQIPDCDVKSVEVMGDHIGLVVVSPAFAGLTPVKKQQLVLSTLSAQFADRSIHAVDYIKSFTPEQWVQQQQQQKYLHFADVGISQVGIYFLYLYSGL